MRVPKNLGMILLGAWLIVWGAIQILKPTLGFDVNTLLALLALAAGILIVLGR